VKRYIPIFFAIPIALVLLLTGCKPANRALASLQYHNLDLKLAKSVMTMSIGDGSVDLRPIMKQATYMGRVRCGRVVVEYPEGLELTARELARKFDEFYPVVEKKLGIKWDFDLILKLVRVPSDQTGFRYSARLGRARVITFPIPVVGTDPNPRWTPVIAHEMTEASMIQPVKRSQLLLADLYGGPICIPLGTRWFRDGTSDYAEYMFAGVVPPASVYSELNRARTLILDWANCSMEPDWYSKYSLYDASTGLICETMNRYGQDSIIRLMHELSKEPAPNGYALKQAYKRAFGVDLVEFLENYETPWTGFVVSGNQRASKRNVQVIKVYSDTPASRRGIKVGDEIVSFAGKSVTSVDGFASILALQRSDQMVSIEISRNGQLIPMRLKLIPMPVDAEKFSMPSN
jgi:hypothetical protein